MNTIAYEPFLKRWKHTTLSSRALSAASVGGDFPSYFLQRRPEQDGDTATELQTTCIPRNFQLGTGANIYTSTILPALLAAKREILLVTCFWAPGRTLDALGKTIEELATQRIAAGLGGDGREGGGGGGRGSKKRLLRLRICLSSVSIFQRLFHTSKKEGYIYPPSKWTKLGLPTLERLEAAGIDMRVKSIFFNPISVLHPKFVVLDREIAFLLSANVSWEPWLEGCVSMTGDAVSQLVRFYQEVWEYGQHSRNGINDDGEDEEEEEEEEEEGEGGRKDDISPFRWDHQTCKDNYLSSNLPIVENPSMSSQSHISFSQPSPSTHHNNPTSTLFLPSTHHRNPHFRPFPWQKPPNPPPTPLNVATLDLLAAAQQSIYFQSPNFTCPAVLDAILAALCRGVDVHIVVGGKNMMFLEQIVTAGTTTNICLNKLTKRYRNLLSHSRAITRTHGGGGGIVETLSNSADDDGLDLEHGVPVLGGLRIVWFRRPEGSVRSQDGVGVGWMEERPVLAHLKLTVVDAVATVLGSGNMDRASFFTSQELGMLFWGEEFAGRVMGAVEAALEGGVEVWFESSGGGG